MDYEKAYNEALERAKNMVDDLRKGEDILAVSELEAMFPQLRESEDERIRKELVDYFASYKIGNVTTKLNGVRIDDILNYLEKQKEQKHPNGCFTCDEYKKGYEEGRRNGFTAGYNKAMKEVEQKEQKPAEWSEEDKKLIDDVINSLCCYQNTLSDYQKEIVGEEIRKLKSLKPQPKQEWSEEDERMLSRCVKSIESSKQFADSDTFKKAKDNEIAWLKSLPLDLKKKNEDVAKLCSNEWSEEDKRILKGIIGLIDHDQHYGVGNKEMLDWLKSLRRPKSSDNWKPSEEQMKALQNAVALAAGNKVLAGLYEQLKSL